jgi:nucleotide-binding universal stress UspA family protein
MFKKILVPLDQSTLAEQALGTAQAIAQASRGEIGLVLAHRMPPYRGDLAPSWSDVRDPEEAVYIRRIADEVARGSRVVVSGTVATGTPVETICRRAHEIDADLIVMTSHGRTGFSRAWLGSVADGVVRAASTPVLLLRAVDDSKALGHGRAMPLFHRILVPLDGSTTSSSILSAAAAMAQCSHASLVLLRVVAPVPIYVFDPQVPAYPTAIEDPDATKQLADEAEDALAAVAANLEHEYSIKAETVVETSGDTARTILEVAKLREADLIAMTTHGRGASRLMLGSVADKVLRGAHLPMLLYHPHAVSPALASADAIRRISTLEQEAEITP